MKAPSSFDLTQVASIATAGVFFLATLYLWSYWGALQVPIFEYAGVSDIVLRAVMPLSLLAILVFILILADKGTEREDRPTKSTAKFQMGSLRPEVAMVLLGCFYGLLGLSAHFIFPALLPPGFHWFFSGFSISIFILAGTSSLGWLGKLIPKKSPWAVPLLAIVLIGPATVVTVAKVKANLIIGGHHYKEVVFFDDTAARYGQLAYLGAVGSKVFFWSFELSAPVIAQAGEFGVFGLRNGKFETKATVKPSPG